MRLQRQHLLEVKEDGLGNDDLGFDDQVGLDLNQGCADLGDAARVTHLT